MWCTRRRAVHWCWLVGVVGLLWFATLPAAACGCGAYIPREGEAHVAQERALIRWDGRTEDIVMELGVEGQSQEAAWILPLPTRATVQLGDTRLFDALHELTKPQVRVERVRSSSEIPDGAAGGAGAAAVTVLERQALGPFDVSTLAANDAQALDQWLSTNGYQFPPRLAETLEPYVAQGWVYVAVRLTAATADQALTGNLDPLWVTFESDKIIYPMRPTALAQAELPVFLYVLAEHRVEPPAPFAQDGMIYPLGWFTVPFANWVEPTTLEQDSPLAPFIRRKLFLTKFNFYLSNPAGIADDFVFPFAARDEIYHQVDVKYEVIERATNDVVEKPPRGTWDMWAFALAAALVVVFGLSLIWRRERR